MDKLTRINIEVAQNGFVVTEQPACREMGIMVVAQPFVFESFATMSSWLALNLKVPADAAAKPAKK